MKAEPIWIFLSKGTPICQFLVLFQPQLNFPLQAKIYSDKRLKTASFCATWELPFKDACLFCHVTDEGRIVVGGQCPGKENIYQIRAYDPYVSKHLTN